MMMSLFSVFDPSTSVFSLNWLSLFVCLAMFPLVFWLSLSRVVLVWKVVLELLLGELRVMIGLVSGRLVVIMILGLFMFIMFNNVFGLLPYVFTGTSHFIITMSLSLPMWLGMMIYGWVNQTLGMFAHLVPYGTPSGLMMFMVLIETISSVIRPLTLAVRLGANMIAGHLLMVLVGGQSSVMVLVILGQFMLLVLELAVAFIQSYVFVTLMTLYYGELS